VIRSLVRIIDQIDVAPAEVKSEFIKLERADASKVVDMLNAVFEKGNQPAGTVPGRNVRPITPPGAPVPAPPPQVQAENDIGAIAALSEESVIVGKIKLAADVRTNRIHVITRPINMPFIRKLIAEFDANVEFAKPVVRPLQFISASDVLAVIVQTLTEPGATGQGGAEGGANPNLNPQQQQQQRRNNSTVTSPYTGGQTATATDSNLNVSEELSTTPTDTTPKAVTVGNAKIIADARANSIIILGNREIVVKVQKLLDEMDVRAPQVALSTVIGELTLSNTEDFGIDYLLKFQRQNGPGSSTGYAGTSLNGNNAPLFDPSKLYNFTQINKAAAATGGILGTNVYVAAGDALTALVHALNTTGRFKTISRPTVFTTNNKKAIIASGQEVPVPVNTITNATGGGIINTGLAQQSNIEFKKVALQLEVVPLINSEKEVSLDILQKIDSLGTPATIDGNLIPTINTRYIRTNVSAPNCSTIILGGLIQEPHTRNTSGIPVLSKIPVVGALFRRTTTDKSRQELIILMRPEVTLTKLDVVRLRAKHEDRTHFGGELEQDDCPDCPPKVDRDDKQLPAPDLPIDK
jgi:type II secretion system protein D